MTIETTESIKELASALVSFQGEVKNPVMSSTNPFYKSKYADLKSVIETAKPILAKHGLAFTQLVNKDEQGGVIETMLIHKSGEFISSSTFYPIAGKPQEQGSAISYMRRYALCAILGLVGDPDDDGEGANKINSPLEGALEEEMRDKNISFKDKSESKKIYLEYVEAFEKATDKDVVIGLIAAAKIDYKDKLLVYEQGKLKTLITQKKKEFGIE
jgi:cellobiose-specific phosphotransferase system component IIA